MRKRTIGFALCGSFCTLARAAEQIEVLIGLGHAVIPIMSECAYGTDTRFGAAQHWRELIGALCCRPVAHTIAEVEAIGPAALLDVLVVAPCTGNTLAKLAAGIADTSVTLACKAHLRNNRPVVLAISTNDALSAAARNIGQLAARKHIYFVPFYQDAPGEKPNSAVARLESLPECIEAALEGQQMQPMLLGPGS